MSAILRELIGDRRVDDMTTLEARRIVAEFYLRVEILTFGKRNDKHMEYVCRSTLERYGLGYFAE